MMKRLPALLVIATFISAAALRAETVPSRPDLSTVKPLASCQLQKIAGDANANYMPDQVVFSSLLQPPPDDPLANYERTPLGDWYKPAASGRDDPWLRVVLLAPSRPVVIDLAVFIDGKPYRNAREAWIDEVFEAAKPVAAGGADAEPTENGAAEEPAGNKEAVAEGTKTSSESSKDAAPSAEEADSNADAKTDETKDEPAIPGVKAQARQAPTMRDRLISYLTAAGAAVDRQEVEWLIAEWGSGPAVVVLGASQAWQRAGVAPLLTYLDQDASGSLSAEEIAGAGDLLKRADVDGNDVVEVSEIRKTTKHSPAALSAAGHSLVELIDANTDWDSLEANLARVYEGKSDVLAKATRELGSAPADITLRIDFGIGDDKEKSGSALAAISVSLSLATDEKAVSATSDVIAVDLVGDYVEFSAAQTAGDKNKDISGSQLAVGAVIDGNPLLRLLDGDQDGRLTLRERQQLSGLLAALDHDADGQISAAEVPVPIRLAVTLGPKVHQLLAKPAGAARTIAPREVSKAPEWFASMDKNSDGDLSRGEFLGTTEQFRQFDENGDQLLGVAEALKLNPGE